MRFDVYRAAALVLFLVGVFWSWFRWMERRWVERTAKRVLDERRALYTEIPEHRELGAGELVDARRKLDAASNALPNFERLADYVDVYPRDSRFHHHGEKPIRVLVDAAGTTTALLFRTEKGIVRIHLCTEIVGGRWVLTENNHNELNRERPEGFHVVHMNKSATPAAMVAKHAETLAASMHDSEPVAVRTFADFVASHTRRWDAIRAHRKSIGWVLPSEIGFHPTTSKDARERVYREIRKRVESE